MLTPGSSNSSSRGVRRIDLSQVELASSERAREHNRDIVLELVRSRQPLARADLSRISGLQPSTISSIVDQLLREGWIVEGAAARRPRGRRPTLLSLNDQLVTLVVDIRPRQAFLGMVDLNGRFLAQDQVPVIADARQSVQRIAEGLERMRSRYPGRQIEGVGISVPGRVDPVTQRLVVAPNLSWTGIDLKGEFESRLKLQVEMDNDATSCLLAELWYGRMEGVRNAVLVSVSEGVGTAILANGQMISGSGGMAGEFGHVSLDPAGPVCGCGQHGCWETFASSTAALRYYAEAAPDSGAISIQELMHRFEEKEPAAVEALSRQARWLGKGLRPITAGLAPEVVLLTGIVTTVWDRLGPVVEEEMRAGMLAGNAPRLEIGTEGDLARLRGAAAMVLQRHNGYHRSTHSRSGKNRSGQTPPDQEATSSVAMEAEALEIGVPPMSA